MAVDPVRLARAVWLDLRRLAPGRFVVFGGRNEHLVELDGLAAWCDCPDACYRGAVCKHQLCALLHHGDGEILRSLRRLIPRPTRRRAL